MSEPPSRKKRPQFVRDAVIAHQDEIRHRLDRGQNMAEILAALALPPAISLDSFRRAFTRLEQRLAARAAARSVIPAPALPTRPPVASPPADPAPIVTYLAVPFADRLEVKAAGAQWDRDVKNWFVPKGTDLTPLRRFSPSPTPHKEQPHGSGNPRKEFVRQDRVDPEQVKRWLSPARPRI